MGQAKARGTREERIQQAQAAALQEKARQAAAELKKVRDDAEWLAGLAPEARLRELDRRRAKALRTAVLVGAVAGSMLGRL